MHSSAKKCLEHAPYSEMVAGNLLCSPDTLCRHIGLLFGERLDTLFYVYPDSHVNTLSDSLRIYFFSLWRADLFYSAFAVEFSGSVWTVAVSGKKKLRIRKYPDTCGRGLSLISSILTADMRSYIK